MAHSRSASPSADSRTSTRALQLAARAVPIAAVAVLLLFALLALFAQPADDDFCFAARVRDLGFAAAQAHWYHEWTGRYVAIGAVSAFAAAGDLLALYPLAAISILLATLASFIALVASVHPAGTARGASAAGATLSALFVAGVPDPAQTFYWLSGSFTYQLGNVAIVLLVATIVLRERMGRAASPWRVALFPLAGACVIVAVGSNEVALALVLLIVGGGALVAWHLHRRSRWFWTGLLVVASVAALASVLAPGNAVRASGLDGAGMLRLPGWLVVAALPPWVGLRILHWATQPALWAAALLVLAATLSTSRGVIAPEGHFDRRYLVVPVLWVLAVVALSTIGFAVNRYPLPERAESVVYLAFLLGGLPSFIVLAHWLAGARLLRAAPTLMRFMPAVLLVTMLGSPGVMEAAQDVYRGHRYAGELRARHDALRAAVAQGTTDAVVASLSRPPRTLFATDVTTDAANHRNRCAAQYFGLRSLRLGTPAQ